MVLCLALGCVVLPWMARNYRLFGSAQLAWRGEMALWMRSNKLDDTPQKMAQAVLYNISEYLGHAVFPGAASDPRDFILEDSQLAYRRQRELIAEGRSQAETNRFIGEEAWQRIRRQPIKFILYTPIEAIKLTAFSYVPSLNEPHVIALFTRYPHGRLVLAALRGVVRLMAYPLLALMFYGLWVERLRWRKNWPLIACVFYVNAVYSCLFVEGRYTVPLIPVYIIFACAAAKVLLQPNQTNA